MPELLSEVAVAAHAALFGGYAIACCAVAGRIGPVREVVGLAGAEAPFGGTPGADNTAAGRVTAAAFGIAALVAPVGALAGTALVVAVPVFAALEVPGATTGGVVEETVAVIE